MNSRSISYDFRAIEKEINPQHTYDEREQFIKDRKSGKVSNLKSQISEKKTLIINMSQMTMEELLKEIPAAEFTDDVKGINTDFIMFLLRNGYIDENYFDYMSYFYPGAISPTEKNYLLLIKNQRPPEPNLPLNKVENVIKRIRNEEWKLPAVLNYAMLDYLLESKDGHLENFIRAFYEYKEKHSDFAFLRQYQNTNKQQMRYFYTELYKIFAQHKNWPNVLFASEGKDSVYDFFVLADVDAPQKAYIDFLSKDVSFLHRTVENDIVETKIRALRLKFDLTEETADYPVFSVLLKCNAYNISRNNFDILLYALNKESHETSITDYYTRVSRLPEKSVKEYVIENIESFANNVMLCGAVSESEDSFIELLNSNSLSDNAKEKLIERNSRKISDITRITHTNMHTHLLNENKMVPTWKNIMECFKNNGNHLGEDMVHFINDEKNADELAKENPLTDEEIKNENGNYEIVRTLYHEILPCEDLSLAAYSKIMAICPWCYKNLSAYNIPYEKMKILIEKENISLTKENYASMKKDHPQLLPALVSVKFFDFIKNDLNLETMEEDMLALLDSDELNSKQKAQLLSADFAVWRTMTDTASLAQIGKIMMEIHYSEKPAVPVNSIIDSMASRTDKIDIMEMQYGNMKTEDIVRIVAGLGAEYAALIEKKGRCPKIEKTSENEKLAKVLEAKRLVSSFAIKENKIEIHQRKKLRIGI